MAALATILPISPRRGAFVGRYRVLRPIASGGMADVFLAVDPKLQRQVALKLPKPGTRHGVVREAKALAQVNHPHVLGVYEVEAGTAGRRPFVALQFIEGQTLRQWCDAGPHRLDEVLETYRRAGLGLAAVHRVGLVHRDFKPDNVLIGDDGQVRLGDFGLAATALPPSSGAYAADSSGSGADSPLSSDDESWLDTLVTQTFSESDEAGGVRCGGTPPYMAPEQRALAEVDARADQYSFCVSLHEAVFGERPLACRIPSLPRFSLPKARTVDTAPRALHDILRRGLAERPTRRWPSMDALLAALAALRLQRAI